jgi:DGQHR domain-containing protein
MQTHKITSPTNEPLELVLFPATEGFSTKYDVDIYEGMLTFGEYHKHFVVEKNSDEINEMDKMQRDVSAKDGRVKSMVTYIKNGASIFTSITIFVGELTDLKILQVGKKEMVVASLDPQTDRHITDGQGRHASIDTLMNTLSSEEVMLLSEHTLSVKIVVTHTDTIFEVRHIVRQAFSDYHLQLRKPSSSLSLYFDSATPYGQLMSALLDVEVNQKPLVEWISLKGKITGHQVYTLAMFANFVQTALGKTKSSLNSDLQDDECFEQTQSLMMQILPQVLNVLPLYTLQTGDTATSKKIHEQALFTKALFLTGLGYLVRSIMEDAIVSGSLSFESLEVLKGLPLTDKSCDTLKQAKIIDEKNKIVSKSDKRIGAYLCRAVRVMPCEALLV